MATKLSELTTTNYKIKWDETSERFFETGVRNCVVYKYDATNETHPYSPGVAWNGITSISESADGGDSNPIYADDIKYLDLRSVEDLNLSLEAYTYPDAFADLDGTAELVSGTGIRIGQQRRKMFGLSYVTRVGNDVDFEEHGDKIHLVYGCMAAPAEKGYETINDSPEAITFSWDISTTPVPVSGFKPTAILTIDTTKPGVTAANLQKLTDALYGSATNATPYLPLPDEVAGFFTTATGG